MTAKKTTQLEDAKKLREDILVRKVKWFLFLPLDLQGKVHEIIETDHAKRVQKGEGSFLWKAKPSSPAAVLTPEVMADEDEVPARVEPVGLEGAPLWIRLRAARMERKLSQAKVGVLFGVIQQALAAWERGPEDGKPIPAELAPLVRRWVEDGTPPTEEELASRRTRRTGGRKPSA